MAAPLTTKQVPHPLLPTGEVICVCRDIKGRRQAELEIIRNRDSREAILMNQPTQSSGEM
jgi:hypothetical protein